MTGRTTAGIPRVMAMLVGVGALLAVAGTPDQVSASDRYDVYLVTMYPGDALFTGFGHIAFRIFDRVTGADDVFDYGTYEAEDPLLGWKFLVGSLKYYCSHTTFEGMKAWYAEDFGGILIQKLNLTDEQAEKLVWQVNHDCLPENAAYAYHHFHNNCATKLRDILDDLVHGELAAATKNKLAGRSLRDLIDASMARWEFAVTRWLVFGLLNWEIDAPADRWQQMFLPWYLSDEVGRIQQPDLPGRPPLVTERELVLGRELPAPELPRPWFGLIFLVMLSGLALVPALLVRLRCPVAARRLTGGLIMPTGLLGGFYGTLLIFSWAASPYPETSHTMALFCFHPLHWLLLPAGIAIWRGGETRVRQASAYFLAGVAISLVVVLLYLTGIIPQRIWHYALGTLAWSAGLWLSLHSLPRGGTKTGENVT